MLSRQRDFVGTLARLGISLTDEEVVITSIYGSTFICKCTAFFLVHKIKLLCQGMPRLKSPFTDNLSASKSCNFCTGFFCLSTVFIHFSKSLGVR